MAQIMSTKRFASSRLRALATVVSARAPANLRAFLMVPTRKPKALSEQWLSDMRWLHGRIKAQVPELMLPDPFHCPGPWLGLIRTPGWKRTLDRIVDRELTELPKPPPPEAHW